MIYHDRVDLWMHIDTGELDGGGNPIFEWQETPNVPAEVYPLNTDLVLSTGRDLVVSRYRVILAPVVDIPSGIGDGLRLSWGAYPITDINLSGPGLYCDGAVERHMLRGRLRHYELISKSVL